MKEYEIAKHIPIRYRRKMVAVKYVSLPARNMEDEVVAGAPRCKNGKCPMGYLPSISRSEPEPVDIAGWLRKHGVKGATKLPDDELLRMSRAFIDAWDEGKIKNLRTALGVT